MKPFSRSVQIRNLNSQEVVSSWSEPIGISGIAWHPNGRTLAVASGHGGLIRLVDRVSLQPVQKLFAGNGFLSHFSLDDQSLAGAVADNKVGVWRVAGGRECRRLVRSSRPEIKFLAAALHPEGRLLAAGMEDGFGFWDLATGRELGFVPLGKVDEQVTDLSFESSGTLLTTGASGLNRWPIQLDPLKADKLSIGPPERVFPLANRISLSADARVLVATSRAVGRWQEYSGTWLWNAGTHGSGVFSPDSLLMAVRSSDNMIWLIDLPTGQGLARLENPEVEDTHRLFFSHDGTQLIGLTSKFDAIRVWDLGLIRASLKEMELDWDRPQLPVSSNTIMATMLPGIQVDLGSLAKSEMNDQQRAQNDIDLYRRAVEDSPDNALACNNLAWTYLTAPESLRDPAAAVSLAEKAVQLADSANHCAMFRNTLGLAYLRSDRFTEAIDCLESNLTESDDQQLAFDLYLLSMCYYKLDEPARARDYLLWGDRWLSLIAIKNLNSAEQLTELNALRGEAQELLGVIEPKSK